ncbi:Ldh family oxidoreductase [Paenibacillus dakarensis]|uniref:Ldh family oxidoreductase n=1 Tax=Paenibacillus dakarensis TaxID=1527293 RepID=UPI0006D59E2B|nr:Ldh family oxidoreductase [Paenibacillus dakarensis]
MNIVSDNSTPVMPETLKSLIATIGREAGMPGSKADFLADLLVRNDLRGVFSHGSKQIADYARLMRDGFINPDPEIQLSDETPSVILADGDGGLGYFPCYRAVEELADRCSKQGVAAAVTRNHGHIGAAGIYSRLLAEKGFIAYVTSGHQLNLSPEDSIMKAAGGSPMSFAVPAGSKAPMILDFGAVHDLSLDSPHGEELFRMAPGVVFRGMGLGFMCQALGGFLAGVPLDAREAQRKYNGANQGSLIIALDVGRFIDPEAFRKQMESYMDFTAQMRPMPGHDEATLPGVLEARREVEWAKSGIPVSQETAELLRDVAEEFGVEMPF